MKLMEWLRAASHMKKWLFLALLGVAFISISFFLMMKEFYISPKERITLTVLLIIGFILLIISARYAARIFFKAISRSGFKISLDSERLNNMLFEKRILIKGPKIVAIGGGTGLSTMLRGLKAYSSNITAVVTVADDGGGSGVLRQDLGMLPPGDIRNCVLALADTEPILEQLLQYRFKEGMLKGQNFGNLFLAAMDGISSSFEEAVHKMSDVLAVTGKVLPVTLEDVKLCAELEDDYVICGETNISKHGTLHEGRIKRVFLEPASAKPLKEVTDAIAEADVVIFGPGSLYTSILPNLLVDGICESLIKSNAMRVFVCNIMTQPGETDGYSVLDHIKVLEEHTFKGIIDCCIVNNADIPEELMLKYRNDTAEAVRIERDGIHLEGTCILESNFVNISNNYVRHDTQKLAESIIELVADTILVKDRKRKLDYYYVKDRLKKAKK